jgi:hypothetical protein
MEVMRPSSSLGTRLHVKRVKVASPFNPFDTSGAMPQPPQSPSSAPPPTVPASFPSSFPSSAPAALETPLTPAGPPVPLLVAAGILGIVGIVVAAIGWDSWIAGIGWALAGPIAIGVMGAFIKGDTDRRAEPVYTRPTWIGAAYAAVAAASTIGILVGAVGVALWVGRL